jgi:uncharacterized caspase-like protein
VQEKKQQLRGPGMRYSSRSFTYGVAVIVLGLCTLLPADAAEEKRVAIVMGNGAYQNTASLPNPPNDARRVSQALSLLGFEVHTLLDATKSDLESLQKDMGKVLRRADVGLFFYAGHGLQINGENFMVPVDASFENVQDLSGELVSLTKFLARMEDFTDINLIFLDACRNNPLADVIKDQVAEGRSMQLDDRERVRNVGQGLAEMKASVGTLIAYATQPGNVAEDGQGANSPFTAGILQHIHEPGMEIREILTSVRVSVLDETNRRQIPWDHSSLTEEFYFIAPVKPRDVPIPPP